MRVKKSLEVLATTDIAVWVDDGSVAQERDPPVEFLAACRARDIAVLHYRRGDDVEAFRRELAAVRLADAPRPLVGDLVQAGDIVVCVCPIDESAPKGRLILPQQQVVRELLDAGASALVCQPAQLADLLARMKRQECRFAEGCDSGVKFVITDSQAFKEVAAVVPPEIPLTSFSIVFARAKGDLAAYCAGAAALDALKDGDRVLISEGCTHHRQCNDIGTVKLPKWISAKTGKKLAFEWTSGNSFPEDLSPYALVVHCGGCMLTRRAVQARIARCRDAGVPITNYGVCIAACHGITASPDTCMVLR